jgi:ATP-binding cassette, subfamily A (ABC1), member 3
LILTTHFLDEADVLADQVIIISKGQLKCEGSTVELKTRLGGGYRVHLDRIKEGPKMDFPSHVSQHETVYSTPDSGSAARLLSDLENKGYGDVHVNGPTIEEVFLKVAEEPHIAVDGEPTGQVGTMSAELEQARSKAVPEWDSMLSLGSEISFFKQVQILFHKRYIILRGNWWPYLVALAMPLAVTPNLKSFLLFYKIPTCLDLTADVHFVEKFDFALGNRGIHPWTHMLVGPPSINASLYKTLSNFPVGVGINFQNYTDEFTFENALSSFQNYIIHNQSMISPGALFMDSNTNAPTYAYVGDFGIEAALLMQNLWTQIRSGIQIEGSFSFFNSLISVDLPLMHRNPANL